MVKKHARLLARTSSQPAQLQARWQHASACSDSVLGAVAELLQQVMFSAHLSCVDLVQGQAEHLQVLWLLQGAVALRSSNSDNNRHMSGQGKLLRQL